jgi:hypothetical protein
MNERTEAARKAADRMLAEDLASTLIAVDAVPLVLRLPAGSAVFALRGEVWLTQEGRRDDVMLAAGARYDVPSRAPIVVSALQGEAQLYVARPADARAIGVADLYEFLQARAGRLRAAAIDALAASARRGARAWARRAQALLRSRLAAECGAG